MTQIINFQKLITTTNFDYCAISHQILDLLSRSIDNNLVIDLDKCEEYNYIFNELFTHFDKWFPNRISFINY